jgi:hypothetical protein
VGVVIRLGETRWLPLRGHRLVGGGMREQEGSPSIYLAEKRMNALGLVELLLKEHRGGGSGDEGGRGPMAASQGPVSRGRDEGAGREPLDLFRLPRIYLAEKRMTALGSAELLLKEHRGGRSDDRLGEACWLPVRVCLVRAR